MDSRLLCPGVIPLTFSSLIVNVLRHRRRTELDTHTAEIYNRNAMAT